MERLEVWSLDAEALLSVSQNDIAAIDVICYSHAFRNDRTAAASFYMAAVAAQRSRFMRREFASTSTLRWPCFSGWCRERAMALLNDDSGLFLSHIDGTLVRIDATNVLYVDVVGRQGPLPSKEYSEAWSRCTLMPKHGLVLAISRRRMVLIDATSVQVLLRIDFHDMQFFGGHESFVNLASVGVSDDDILLVRYTPRIAAVHFQLRWVDRDKLPRSLAWLDGSQQSFEVVTNADRVPLIEFVAESPAPSNFTLDYIGDVVVLGDFVFCSGGYLFWWWRFRSAGTQQTAGFHAFKGVFVGGPAIVGCGHKYLVCAGVRQPSKQTVEVYRLADITGSFWDGAGRERFIDVCISLAPLDLPVLLVLLVFDHFCDEERSLMDLKWRIAKHILLGVKKNCTGTTLSKMLGDFET